MSNEIQAQASLQLTQAGNQINNWSSGSVSLNQYGTRSVGGAQLVTTGAVGLGSIPGGTLGYVMIQNLGTVTGNIVYLLNTTGGVTFAQLDINEIALFKLSTSSQNVSAMVSSGSCPINVLILEL